MALVSGFSIEQRQRRALESVYSHQWVSPIENLIFKNGSKRLASTEKPQFQKVNVLPAAGILYSVSMDVIRVLGCRLTRACSPTPLCGRKIARILAVVSARLSSRSIGAARLMRNPFGGTCKACLISSSVFCYTITSSLFHS